MNTQLGVIEGFFGPDWPMLARKSYASFLASWGGAFYIYAPKRDQYLRKNWRENWDESYLQKLNEMQMNFKTHGVKFGVGLSPFGIGNSLKISDVEKLTEKILLLSKLKIDILGLFFDDMPIHDSLAKTQLETLKVLQNNFSGKIIFCPSFYSFDPVLDKVFGTRPENYLEEIGSGANEKISILWTGPKVISPEISASHLEEIKIILQRSPFLWDNLYANDGPKNCKFLKLKNFSGRDEVSSDLIEGIGLNMMNQPELSKVLYLSSKYVIQDNLPSEDAFVKALSVLMTPAFQNFLLAHRDDLLHRGLDNLSTEKKATMKMELSRISDIGAREIESWLQGAYSVGPECLTD